MGADYYETPDMAADAETIGRPPIGIGDGAVIEGAIVDKNCRIGAGAQVVNKQHVDDGEAGEFCAIRDGILVVEKDAALSCSWTS